MSEPVKTATVYPALSTEQKLLVRDLQIGLVTARETAQSLVQQAEAALVDGVKKLAVDMGVEFKNFDGQTLQFKD